MNSAGEPLTAADLERHLRVLRAAVAGFELTTAQILGAVDTYLAFLPEEQRSQVVQRWLDDRVELEPAVVLRREGGPRPWFAGYDPTDGYHWRRLREYLLAERGRSESVVDSLDRSTDQILEMLEDPRPQGPSSFRVRGLVIGYVQSGKTANFSALIAKAFDCGYRIVVVLSGLHNSLRRQTQLRLEDELGLVAPTPGRPGVGLAEADQQISRMTRPETSGDFNPGTADSNLLYSGARTILVVKKNASVLRRLVGWMEARQPITPPVLVIDDEADQASINTGGNRPGDDEASLDEFTDLAPEDVDAAVGPDGIGQLSGNEAAEEADPSVINGLIRQLLDRMQRVAYVGYTATPFANVLIGHDYHDREVGEELYPSDFILSLPRPNGYVGPERLFGRGAMTGEGGQDVQGLDVIRNVPAGEADSLVPGRRGGPPVALPQTLKMALLDFVLAVAARDSRTGSKPASSMLIHASQLVAQQDILARLVRDRVAQMRQRWRYDQANAREEFRSRWESHFRPVSEAVGDDRVLAFEQIEEAITHLFRRELPVLVLHNRSADELDYERNPHLRAVLVGGNKLSRGLTLEGLLVSYYVRRANHYDTLLQMGRWFGYREDYVDLTRLYTTSELAERFRDLATYEEELRREIRLYEQLGLTPRDFGPRIRTHPAMQITARNRMGSARPIAYNYAATLQQTITFELSRKEWLQGNLEATRRFLAELGTPNAKPDAGGGERPTWSDVDWRHVEWFLGEYKTHADSTRFVANRVREYVTNQALRHGELIRWTVGVRSLIKRDPRWGDEDLSIAGQPAVHCISRNREFGSETSIGTLVNPISREGRGDEDLGLTDEDRTLAGNYTDQTGVRYPVSLRRQRSPQEGLLLIYPISRLSYPAEKAGESEEERAERGKQRLFDNPERDGVTVIGVAVSLPNSQTESTISYVVGSAGAAPI
jgi:hypothetical protein